MGPGVTLEELFGRGVRGRLEPIRRRLGELMAEEGLPYAASDRVYNTRAAQELAVFAEAQGVSKVHDALFRAYFAEGRDIGSRDVLLGVARDLGVSVEGARRALDDRAFAEQVDDDWQCARSLGITAVPTFVIGDRGLVGAQPIEELRRLVESAGVPRRTSS